ncbi:MAG: leucine-rich repeat domain-containing protein [Oscillospiraceae bacterium]|nr:leucine-rich repeat domain-containing protein [Oscillospiraceae bacterium]
MIKADDTVEIRNYTGKLKHLTIPGLIDDTPVTSIGDNAFSNNRDLSSITIPDSVTEIGNNAFFNNTRLSWVTLPGKLKTIGYSAFYNCKALTHILIPEEVTHIGFEAFGGNSQLMTVYFLTKNEPKIGMGNTSLPTPVTGNAFLGMPEGARAVIPTGARENYSINPVDGTWNNLIVYTEEEFGIDYNAPQITAYATSGPNDELRAEFAINLSTERLIIPDYYTIRSYSIDGGRRWKRVSNPEMFNKVNFPRLLDKGMRLVLSDTDINPLTKQPYDNFTVVKFPQIAPRPKLFKLNVNYLLLADETGVTAGRWTLAEPVSLNTEAKKALKESGQYNMRSVEEEFKAVISDNGVDRPIIEVGLAMDKNSPVDNRGFGMMQPKGSGDNSDGTPRLGGIPVFTYREFGSKDVVKTPYVVRIPPRTAEMAGTLGYTFIPGSKPRTLNISSELKPPKYAVNYRKQEIRFRRGVTLFRGSELMLTRLVSPPEPGLAPAPSALLTDLKFEDSWYTSEKWDKDYPSKVKISTAEFIGALSIWTRAGSAKPASAKQLLRTPPGIPADTTGPKDRFAYVDEVTVDGTYIPGGTNSPIETQQIIIRLRNEINETFTAQSSGTDVNWLNLPGGLSAVLAAPVAAGADFIAVNISGTPTASSTAYIEGTIPGAWLSTGDPLAISVKSDARYNIIPAMRQALIAGVIVQGSVTVPFESPYQQFTINLTNETFANIAADTDVSAWFTSRPGTSVTAQVVSAVTAGASSITIEISGTPTMASTANITGTIPVSAVQGASGLSITSSSNARWNISNRTAAISGLVVVGGRVNTALPTSGATNTSGEDLTLTINLTGDRFNSTLATTNVTGWFGNIPNGLTATAVTVSGSGNSVTIRFTGTPTAISNWNISNVTIPESAVRGASLPVSVSSTARWRVWDASALYGGVSGNVNVPFPTGSDARFLIMTISGDSIYTVSPSWVTNVPDGIEISSTPPPAYSSNGLTYFFSGTPTAEVNTPINILIPGSALSSQRNLTINISDIAWNITP